MSWKDWKVRLSIEQLLLAIGHLERMRSRGERLIGPCPVHHGDNENAFHIDCRRNLWHCFTGCATGGDSIALAWHLCGRSWPRTAQWLGQLSGDAAIASRPASPLNPASCQPFSAQQPQSSFRPFCRALPLQTEHPFFRRLDLEPATLRHFEAGVWPHRGYLCGMAAVRLHDLSGQPLGYAGRRLDPDEVARHGKWKWPPRFPKAHLLYNWHRTRPDSSHGLLVVEGPWSVLKLWQAGFQNVVALGGTAVSAVQRALLGRTPRLLLFLDADDAGEAATRRLREQRLHPNLLIVRPPSGTDPADLDVLSLQTLLAPLVPVRN